ncbi:Tn3 family transposase [Brevibacillus agri]|nr:MULTISPECIES: Tn3 family transposase [Brevibacillus]MED1646637.1 Tn3 family transposase [Brevibacillus agri]MED1657377.1 Tn3 family transposase [Brevibacillus agri]MED1688167.1 Tn3 family transposase [Brevibacillus agri]MED1695404.1 Tn3 family transposase [Brevibacillus agri]MED1699074.1 Tn3 family transposase [Brevibacillus agri]
MTPSNGEWELATYYTFSQHDLDIINRHRRDYNRLGFAVQLALLRYPGWSITDMKEIPDFLLDYLAKQLDIEPGVFSLYARRENTLWDHLKEIREEYRYTTFTTNDYRRLLKYLFKLALENGNAVHLIRSALDEMRRSKIILPAITTIERVVWEARHRAEERIYRLIHLSLTSSQKQKLDKLIEPVIGTGKTKLGWLKETTGQFSPEAFLKVIERLDYIRSLQLNIDTRSIHPNRLRQLSRLGSRYEPQSFRRFHEAKRYTVLVAYLLDLSQDLVDQAFEIHDKQVLTLQSKGRKQQEEIQKQNGKAVNEKVVHYADLGDALIKARDQGIDPFVMLETVMPWEKFVESVEEAKKLSRPLDYDYLDLLESRFNYLRKYTPTLLNALEFRSTKSAEPLMRALDTIREMNQTGKRKIPEGAPLDFVSNRWQKHVFDEDGTINRHYYEMAALTELRNYVRSGDVSIVGSRQHKDFDEYLVPQDEWKFTQATGTRLAVSLNVDEYLEERTSSLLHRLQWISENIDALEGVNIEKGRLHVHRLEKDVPEEAKQYSSTLYGMLPRVKLTDLLLEVASWTGFDEQFVHASTNRHPKAEEKPIVLAALMAMGTNIGLTKMADATPGISYHQMANAAQWRMYDDAMNRAQATLVNFHHRRSLAAYWGDGSTSSSDGMRVQVGVSSLSADPNPHYGSGKGATIYRFVSDQFSSFYTKVINTNARDAVHVIDGLLHHESDLSIEEHYTDTAGYTDQVFGLTHLLGFRFAPRLRDLSDSKLYVIGKPSDFPKLENLLRGQIDMKVIRDNYDDVLRLAHSIREGKVSGALIMGKLGSYARQNRVAKALREMGRIEKTIFILDYISSESMRRRIQRGLNKGEAMNALARAIFFGKHGELRERALQDQLQRASALNILINAISVWNTVYLGKATDLLRSKGALREDLLKHMSPLGWEHINFLGEYRFDPKGFTTLESLRPLNEG